MKTRLVASFLLAALAATASARSFSQPPPATPPPSAPAEARVAPTSDDVAPLDEAAVRQALASRRAHHLAAFRAYRNGGSYPHNFQRSGPLNVWRDREGHLCAAATIINRDGNVELVADTAKTNNQIRLLDVTEGPLLDWMLTSGFTIEEIDRIQAPMVRPVQQETVQPEWRVAEDARLKKLYAETDAYLVKHERAGLDLAMARLMERPELARALLASGA
jgi:hypothetical protein